MTTYLIEGSRTIRVEGDEVTETPDEIADRPW
jgi:hypothetical protein